MKGNLSNIDSLRSGLLAILHTVDRMRCEVENLADITIKGGGEAGEAKHLLEDLAVTEERQEAKPSPVVENLCRAAIYLLRREAEREEKEAQ